MSETLWDVERLTEATRHRCRWRHRPGEVVEAERGRVKLRMLSKATATHRHDVRRRAAFVSSRRHTLLDDLRCLEVLPDRQRRRHLVRVRRHRHHRRGIDVGRGGRPHRGGRRRAREADYDLVMELKDTDGNVVAISTNRYQMRSHGIDRAQARRPDLSENWTNV